MLVKQSGTAFSYTPNDGFAGDDSFTFVTSDGESISNIATVDITVNDLPSDPGSGGPDVGSARASIPTVWPPNGKMISVTIEGVTGNGEVAITITGIMQDEETADSADGSGVGTDTAQLRAERDGSGDGRGVSCILHS